MVPKSEVLQINWNLVTGYIELKDNFNLNLTTEKKVLEVLQFTDISKAAGIDKISGKFLKDGANDGDGGKTYCKKM